MTTGRYPKIGGMAGIDQFRSHLSELGIAVPCDDTISTGAGAPLCKPIHLLGRCLANRFAVQPMEGWDGTLDGLPSSNTVRRWQHFGDSGAALVWGGEAVAVRQDGRGNPNQLLLSAQTQSAIVALRDELLAHHKRATDDDAPPLVGLQLTHSGRFSRPDPDGRPKPVIAYHHPILDRRLGLDPDYPVITDGEIRRLVDDFVEAARLAAACGFDFVDVKHCHGYLAHELLGAKTRPGAYGGSLENRTRFLREVVSGIRAEVPELGIGVRLSAFDMVPFRPDPERAARGAAGPGVSEIVCACMPYVYGFGVDEEQPAEIDLTETYELFDILRDLGIPMVNVTGGSPYYTPHLQRPALYPPSDAYAPPEDPLVGVARHIHVTRCLKQAYPEIVMVGSGYTYLQEYLPNVAQGVIREGWTDLVGLGRMMLSYPTLPKDVLAGCPVDKRRLCRTFSDCTTAPRAGLVSGCYPLDPHYRASSDAPLLAARKHNVVDV